MLKWAVNGPRRTYLRSVGECEVMHDRIDRATTHRSLSSFIEEGTMYGNIERRRVRRRKASDLCSHRRKFCSGDKENQLTSTPLPVAMSDCNNSPSRKLDSNKDLSSIIPDDLSGSPLKNTSLREILLRTPEVQLKQSLRYVTTQYASTLPTFDVEYSPCGLVPGPILALRGVGITDTYFEKPRYLTQEDQEHNRHDKKPANSFLKSLNNEFTNYPSANDEESLISSSKMGDMTLERMIDAILESARKERKLPKLTKQTACAPVMSPTYTPADDPASDLNEFWDASSEQYYQKSKIKNHIKIAESFNEREVRSPLARHHKLYYKQQQESHAFKLRRQRAVRRKRKMSPVSGSVKTSTQKMFFIGDVLGTRKITNKNLDLVNYELTKPSEDQPTNQSYNISPDSGRNSSSDFEDLTLEGSDLATGIAIKKSEDIFDTTKRRLSFSVTNFKS